MLEALFDVNQLGGDVHSSLEEERIQPPAELTIAVNYPEEALVEMRILCERVEKDLPAPPSVAAAERTIALVPAWLVTLSGVSSAPELPLDRPRINLGREEEVVDALGRAIRRNELSFPGSRA